MVGNRQAVASDVDEHREAFVRSADEFGKHCRNVFVLMLTWVAATLVVSFNQPDREAAKEAVKRAELARQQVHETFTSARIDQQELTEELQSGKALMVSQAHLWPEHLSFERIVSAGTWEQHLAKAQRDVARHAEVRKGFVSDSELDTLAKAEKSARDQLNQAWAAERTTQDINRIRNLRQQRKDAQMALKSATSALDQAKETNQQILEKEHQGFPNIEKAQTVVAAQPYWEARTGFVSKQADWTRQEKALARLQDEDERAAKELERAVAEEIRASQESQLQIPVLDLKVSTGSFYLVAPALLLVLFLYLLLQCHELDRILDGYDALQSNPETEHHQAGLFPWLTVMGRYSGKPSKFAEVLLVHLLVPLALLVLVVRTPLTWVILAPASCALTAAVVSLLAARANTSSRPRGA